MINKKLKGNFKHQDFKKAMEFVWAMADDEEISLAERVHFAVLRYQLRVDNILARVVIAKMGRDAVIKMMEEYEKSHPAGTDNECDCGECTPMKDQASPEFISSSN